jgi:hypothetical protein
LQRWRLGKGLGASLTNITNEAPAQADALNTADPALNIAEYAWSKQAKPLGPRYDLLRFGSYLQIVGHILMLCTMGLTILVLAVIVGAVELDEARLALVGMALVALGTVAPYLVYGALALCVIFYLMFVYRAVSNLRLSKARGLSFSPASAVWWSFVPFANLLQIYRAMKEVWVSSRDPVRPRHDPPSSLAWWWGMWLGSGALGRLSDPFTRSGITDQGEILNFNDAVIGLSIAAASSVASIASIFCLLAVIRQVVDFQNKLAQDAKNTAAVAA